MSKKIIGIIIIVAIVLLVVIGTVYVLNKDKEVNEENKIVETNVNKTNIDIKKDTENNFVTEEKISNESKILIVFFSRADENYSVGNVDVGNTEIMAGFIKDYLKNASVFKIEPVVEYPKEYKACTDVATEEKNNNARPEFKGSIDVSEYDTVFLGYPIWWGDVPMIINTFIEKNDLSGKTIIPFCTHEGSGNAGTFTSLKSKLHSSDVITNGLAIRGSNAREESSRSTVENWLKELGY